MVVSRCATHFQEAGGFAQKANRVSHCNGSSKAGKPSRYDAYLLAPRGTVDAGDAGIRVSGDLSILAVRVANADNISVGGKTTGVPTVAAPNVGGLTAANDTAGASAKATVSTTGSTNDRPSIIIVEVLGYGGSNPDDGSPQPAKPKQGDDRQTYDPNGDVRVLGYATLGEADMVGLTEEQKNAIRN